MGFDPFVESGFDPKKMADGGEHDIRRERGRTESKRIACVIQGQLVAVGLDG